MIFATIETGAGKTTLASRLLLTRLLQPMIYYCVHPSYPVLHCAVAVALAITINA